MTMGIYLICNSITGHVYLGSSVNIKSRFPSHKSPLRGGYHFNPRLQEAWIEFGEDAFAFYIIEEVADKADLNLRERYWIMQLKCWNPEFGYNAKPYHVAPKTSLEVRRLRSENNRKRWADPEYKKRVSAAISFAKRGKLGRVHSPETRAKIAAGNRGIHVGKIVSKETRDKISAGLIGRKHSPETREKMSKTRKAAWGREEYRNKVMTTFYHKSLKLLD